MLITDLAVFVFDKYTRKMTLIEIAENTTIEEV
jgi:acyl CoA:acetate/3-ketoacid CoA transferase beta subunit